MDYLIWRGRSFFQCFLPHRRWKQQSNIGLLGVKRVFKYAQILTKY